VRFRICHYVFHSWINDSHPSRKSWRSNHRVGYIDCTLSL